MKALNLKITDSENHFKQGLKVSERYSEKEKQKLAKASKDFESILTSMMIKSMTKTTEGLFGKDNYGGNVLDVLFETELSKFITNSKGMGIAEQIYKNLAGENYSDKLQVYEKTKPSVTNKFVGNDSIEKSNYMSSNKALDRIKKYDEIINEASRKYDVDKKLIKSVIMTESAGKADARSKANAKGLMQLMDSTSADMGVQNPWDPKENIFGGTKYLAKMLNDFKGNKDLALAAYNAGPGNVKKYGGIPPFSETKFYVSRVNNYLNILE